MSLDDLMNALEDNSAGGGAGSASHAPTGGVRVVEERGNVHLKQVPKEDLPRNHPSLLGLQDRGGQYDVVQERNRDEAELNDLISGLDSLSSGASTSPRGGRPISRPPPAEMPPPPPAGTLKRPPAPSGVGPSIYSVNNNATAHAAESYQPAAVSPTSAMPVRESVHW